MKSVEQIYGLEKNAFVSAMARGALAGLRQLPRTLSTASQFATSKLGLPQLYRGTKAGLKRIPENISKTVAKNTMGENVMLAGSGIAALNLLPRQPLQRITGLDDNMLLSMVLDPTSGRTDYFKKSDKLIQDMRNLGQTSSIPKIAGDQMYNHKGIIKEASKRNLAQYAAAGLGIGVGAPLAMYGIGKGVKATQARTLNRDYQKVVQEDPSLKNAKAKKLYGVLHRTAPQVAREPLVASKVLKNMMEIPQITPQTFSDVLRLESLYQQTEMPYYGIKHGMKPGDLG